MITKIFTFISYGILLPFMSIAQFNYDPELFVLAAAGDYTTESTTGYQMSWTMGEVIAFDAVDPGGESIMIGYQQGVNQTLVAVPVIDPFPDDIDITLFPNPTSELLYIDFENTLLEQADIVMFDNQGRVVKETAMRPLIYVGSLPQGNYFIAIRNESIEIVKPFIVIK